MSDLSVYLEAMRLGEAQEWRDRSIRAEANHFYKELIRLLQKESF